MLPTLPFFAYSLSTLVCLNAFFCNFLSSAAAVAAGQLRDISDLVGGCGRQEILFILVQQKALWERFG